MASREFARGRRLVARLPHGADLLEAIAAVADEHGVLVGESTGDRRPAARHARVLRPGRRAPTASGSWTRPLELVTLLGNVSRRDGATAVHVHATLSDHDGVCFGGHVAPGCTVFACELFLQELVGGEPLERAFDEETGLPLWRNV